MSYRYCLVGKPISHSFSPIIYDQIAKFFQKKEFSYSLVELEEKELERFVLDCDKNKTFQGFNITLPYKEVILKSIPNLSQRAKITGAANVIKASESELYADNTDVLGIESTLRDLIPKIEDSAVLVWGAGGASRALLYAIGNLGIKKVFLMNRDMNKAKLLCEIFQKNFPHTMYLPIHYQSDNESLSEVKLAVHTTSLGVSNFEIPKGFFNGLEKVSPEALAWDLNYTNLYSLFLSEAKKNRLKTKTGTQMLVEQASYNWEMWFPEDKIPRELKKEIEQQINSQVSHKPIYLTGLMGSGKTSVGRILSKRMEWEFWDSDQVIESKKGKSISEIFDQEGEESFRLEEKNTVIELTKKNRVVIALGGGSLNDSFVREKIKKSGTLIYLKTEPANLEGRLERDPNRPLLSGKSSIEKINVLESLLESRRAIYEEATFSVDTDFLKPEEVADLIFKSFRG